MNSSFDRDCRTLSKRADRAPLRLKAMALALGALSIVVLPDISSAQQLSDIKPSPPLTLKGEGSFFVGGNTHVIDSKYISPSIFFGGLW